MRDQKRVWRVCFSAVLVLAMAGFATASAAQNLQRIKQRGAVTIGYRDDASPFSLVDKGGKPVGYAVELCQSMAGKIASEAGLASSVIRYLPIPVDQIERFVKAGNVDLFCSATSDTPERRKSMDFSPPIYIAGAKALVRKQDAYKSLADLGGKAVVVIDKTTAVSVLATYVEKSGVVISSAKAVGPDAALGQLRLGWVAGYVRDEVLLAAQLAGAADADSYTMLPESLSAENVAIAFPPGDAGFQKLVTQLLTEAYTAGLINAAYERWFNKPIPPKNLTLNLPMSGDLKASLAKLK